MRLFVAVMFSALAVAWPVAAKKPQPSVQQGAFCDRHRPCTAGLRCLPAPAGDSTCEIPCPRVASSANCPDDQRCVKDGARRICRPNNHGVDLAPAKR